MTATTGSATVRPSPGFGGKISTRLLTAAVYQMLSIRSTSTPAALWARMWTTLMTPSECLYVCVCMRVLACVCVFVLVCVFVSSLCVCVSVCVWLSVCVYVCVHVCVYAYVCGVVCVCVWWRMRGLCMCFCDDHSFTISRVSNQKGISLLYIVFEIHHSGREPVILHCAVESSFCELSITTELIACALIAPHVRLAIWHCTFVLCPWVELILCWKRCLVNTSWFRLWFCAEFCSTGKLFFSKEVDIKPWTGMLWLEVMSTKTECDYLYGRIKKWSHTLKISQKNGEPLRYSLEHRRKGFSWWRLMCAC